jgi:predicted RNA-binding protein with PUA-like domain
MARRYWLMKTEPSTYSIDDLAREKRTCWDGVRNYQARNLMRDEMRVGDLILFYHSNAKPPGVVGLARVCRESYPDHTAWDPESEYYDSRATPDNPVWLMVDVEFVERFPEPISLERLKENSSLDGMLVIKKGQRLSIQPVIAEHFEVVLEAAGSKVST